jgi:hypothetical protein
MTLLRERRIETASEERLQSPDSSLPTDTAEWLVKTTETVKLVLRARQLLVGSLEVPQSRENPPLVCIEPAQLPFEGVLLARGVPRSCTQQPEPPRANTAPSAGDEPLNAGRTKTAVHVMVVNISHEEVELPKGTLLGVAEKISETLVATVNDGPGVESRKIP